MSVARRIIPLVPDTLTKKALGLAAPPPLSLYVHFPWCVRKCPYCDFNSHAARDDGIPQREYLAALVADLEAALPQVWGRRIGSVFIGGGTPSLITPEGLDELLAALRMRLPLDPLAEITLEANPGTAEAGRFRAYRAAGVNRISLGIQSFNDRHLRALGRIHDAQEAAAAAALALETFETVNLDLMYALPGQTLAEALTDLERAIRLAPAHLSCYHLTIEPNTPFAASPPALPDDDLSADMQDALESHLAAAGYRHYETSAFALPGRECRHNLNYWTFGDYLGIGAGAHGKLSNHEGILREMRHKHPAAYLRAAREGTGFVQERRQLGIADLPFEFMMNALRLNGGVPARLFEERTGLPLSSIAAPLAAARERGLLAEDPARLQPTERGRRFLNDLLQGFLQA